jgi:hypothetical protein
MSIETRSQDLANMLVTRNFEPEYYQQGRSVPTADNADMFSFDYVSSGGHNYGTVVIMFQQDDTFLLLSADNMARGMQDSDSDEWFGFLNQLKQWAVSPGSGFRNFSVENLAKLRHYQAGMAAIREGLFEGYYGTRHVSYMGEACQARLMIRHKRPLGEGDARHRQIDSLFVETADGERYRLPFRNLAGGRAMLEHVRAGGRPWDVRGVHIAEMISEIAVLSRFRRAQAGRVLEGVGQDVAESADHYYKTLREGVRRLGTSRGYAEYFESWVPDNMGEHEELVENIRQLFVQHTLDPRIEAALPVLARIQQGKDMKEIQVFEAWAARIAEGTWALPQTPEQKTQLTQLLSQPLTVGTDAADATEQLYDLVGDDHLFDLLSDLADRDPGANAWDDPAVMDRMWELADASPELADALTQVSTDTPTQPDSDEEEAGMAEALGDLRPKLGSRRDQGKSIRKWRKARGLDESDVAEGLNEFVDTTGQYGGGRPDITAKYLYGQDFLVTVNGTKYSLAIEVLEDGGTDGYWIVAYTMLDIEGRQPSEDIQDEVCDYIEKYHQKDLVKAWETHDKRDEKHPDYYYFRFDKEPPQKVSDFVKKGQDKGVAEGNGMFGDEEVSWEKGGRRAPTGAFRNPAVVKAHQHNLDAAQKEMDRREAEGEDMTGAKIDPKTYKIIKPVVSEGRVKQMQMDLTELTDEEFLKKYHMTKAQARKNLTESSEHNPVVSAVTRRIMLQRTDLLAKYGPERVMQAIEDVADYVGDAEEIGSSDVSAWVRNVEQQLSSTGDHDALAESSADQELARLRELIGR